MTTIHTPRPTSYAIPHPAKHMSIGKRAALAAIGTIGAAAALGGAVSAYAGSVPAQAVAVPAPAVAVVAPDTVVNPPAVSAPDAIQPVTLGSTVVTTTSCSNPISPPKPGHQQVAFYTCVYPQPVQGGGAGSGAVEAPGGGVFSGDGTDNGNGADNGCPNLDGTECHATQ